MNPIKNNFVLLMKKCGWIKILSLSLRSPNQGGWDQEREHSEDRDSHSNRSHKSDNRNRSSGHGRRDSESGSRNRDEHGKRYSGSRRTRHSNENEERWRSDSPLSNRGFRKDSSREVRQVWSNIWSNIAICK